VVGLLGLALQLTLVWLATSMGCGALIASLVAVMLTIVHNFAWHCRWTWRDRRKPSIPAALLQFALGNGIVSVVCTLVLVPALAGPARRGAIAANLVAIAAAGLLNFQLADRIVFNGSAPVSSEHGDRCPAP
jgi:putative flippase GtrA